MHHITHISSAHAELGKCNPFELCSILESLRPEVIFLEALSDTYSVYDQLCASFGAIHKKVEIAALQLYGSIANFEFETVLNEGIGHAFDKKCQELWENSAYRHLFSNFNYLQESDGFCFLNSDYAMKLQEQMGLLGNCIIKDAELNEKANEEIDAYEKTMLQNIYDYCREHQFEKSVFMCGVGHRKSMIEKFKQFNLQEGIHLNWTIYQGYKHNTFTQTK